jgi:DNA-binding HxlR family transcriptional regulator
MSNEILCDGFCPVSKALVFISKKWSIEIIRDMFFGKKRFKEFKEGNPNLSNKVLSECLKNLENNGLIEKKIINSTPISTEYYLTERGKALNRVIYELAVFALEECNDKEYDEETTRIRIKKTFRENLQIDD